MTENPDQQRMERCAAIASKVIANWEATNNFQYTLRATDSIAGLDLTELRKRTFKLGAGEDLTEVSLSDVLTVFALLEQQGAAIQQLRSQPQGNYTVTVQVPPEFSDVEAVRILSQLRIETPFDSGEVTQWFLGKRPPSPTAGQAKGE
jgi:hypothetical protein